MKAMLHQINGDLQHYTERTKRKRTRVNNHNPRLFTHFGTIYQTLSRSLVVPMNSYWRIPAALLWDLDIIQQEIDNAGIGMCADNDEHTLELQSVIHNPLARNWSVLGSCLRCRNSYGLTTDRGSDLNIGTGNYNAR